MIVIWQVEHLSPTIINKCIWHQYYEFGHEYLPTYKHSLSARAIRPLLLRLILIHVQFELAGFRSTAFLHPRRLSITISTFSASIFPFFIFYSTICVSPSKTLFTLLPTLALVAMKGIYFLGEPLGGGAISDLLPTIII